MALENDSRDVHTLDMVGGQPGKVNPPPTVSLQVRQVLQDGCHRLEYPGHRAQERDDLPDCKPSRLVHVDTPRGADPAEGALRPRRAQDCYGSRRKSMAARPTSSQLR